MELWLFIDPTLRRYGEGIMKLLSCDEEIANAVYDELLEHDNGRYLLKFVSDYHDGIIVDNYFQCKAEIRTIAEKYMPGTKEEE